MVRPWAIGSLAVVLVAGIAIAVYVIRAPDTSAPAVTPAVSESEAEQEPSRSVGSETAAKGSAEQADPDPAGPTELQPADTPEANASQTAEGSATDGTSSPTDSETTEEAADQTAAARSEPAKAPKTTTAPSESPTQSEAGTPSEVITPSEPAKPADPVTPSEAGTSSKVTTPSELAKRSDPVTPSDEAKPSEEPTSSRDNRDQNAEDPSAGPLDPPRPSFPPPSFDIVRIERSGEAVIAGRSAPGSEVEIILNGQVLGRVTSDDRGQWVFLPTSPLASGNHELSLRSQSASGVETESDNIVVVVVPDLKVAGSGQEGADEPGQTVEAEPSEETDPAAETQTEEVRTVETQTSETQAGKTSTAPSQVAQTPGNASAAPADKAARQGTAAASPEVTEIATIPDPNSPSDVAASSESTRAQSSATELSTADDASAQAVTSADTDPVQTGESPASPATPTRDEAEPQPSQSADAKPAEAEPQDEAEVDSQGPLAILLPRDGQGGAKILQDPAQTGVGDLQLVLRSVDYDADGNVTISGEASPGAKVIVYLDNEAIGQGVVGKAGLWRFTPRRPVSAGLHRLRVDQLDDDGSVVARVETPFSRAAILTDLPQEQFVVVQPGNSLWRIARSVYGEGPRYSVIYQSNQSQIREPDLIYPGQIFLVPQLN